MLCMFHCTASAVLFLSLHTCLFVFLSPVSPLPSYAVFPVDSLSPTPPFIYVSIKPSCWRTLYKGSTVRWLARAGVKKGSNYSSMRDSSALCWPLDGLALGSHCPRSAADTHWTGLKSCSALPENNGVKPLFVYTSPPLCPLGPYLHCGPLRQSQLPSSPKSPSTTLYWVCWRTFLWWRSTPEADLRYWVYYTLYTSPVVNNLLVLWPVGITSVSEV